MSSTDVSPRCAACGKAGDDLKTCGGCKEVNYCNAVCQKAHRPAHKMECRISAATRQTMAGAVTLAPPQPHIFCGICDTHFMFCRCKGQGQGVDYIFKDIPPPSPKLSRVELLRRFACIASVSPARRGFDAMGWHANEAVKVATAIEHRRSQLKQMMEDYITTLPTSDMLNDLAAAVGGQPLRDQTVSIQCSVVAKECRAALHSFISGDWSTVTLAGVLLIQNAFQASDPNRYRLDDAHLIIIFQNGIACLLTILQMGFSDKFGWRLALECDRPPEGTDNPVKSATDRDYFLHNYVPS